MQKHKCPRCGKNAFRLDEDWTCATCSKCGFHINYKELPFMAKALEIVRIMKKASN